MKSLRIALLSGIILSGSLSAADVPAATPSSPVEQWSATAAPVSQHEELASLAGRWKTRQYDWTLDGKLWNEAAGVAVFKPILGGRFIQQSYSSRLGRHPYRAVSLLGYDQQSGRYVSSWLDNFGSSIYHGEGSMEGAVLTAEGRMGTGAEPEDATLRVVETWTDANHHSYEMWVPGEGGQYVRLVRIEYTRS